MSENIQNTITAALQNGLQIQEPALLKNMYEISLEISGNSDAFFKQLYLFSNIGKNYPDIYVAPCWQLSNPWLGNPDFDLSRRIISQRVFHNAWAPINFASLEPATQLAYIKSWAHVLHGYSYEKLANWKESSFFLERISLKNNSAYIYLQQDAVE